VPDRERKRRLVLNLRDERPIWSIPAWAVEEIRAALPGGWEVVEVTEPADGRGDGGEESSPEVLRAVRGAEAYAGWGVPRDVFAAATAPPDGRLRWAHSASAGVGGALYEEMRRSDVALTNSAGVHAEPIADTVLAMMLYFARGLDWAVRAQAERRLGAKGRSWPPTRRCASWRSAPPGSWGWAGSARRWRSGARRWGCGGGAAALVRAAGPEGVEVLSGDGALDRLLSISDYLVVTVPMTAETEGMIGARELASAGKRGAGERGARRRGGRGGAGGGAAIGRRLRGAGLDVFAASRCRPSRPCGAFPMLLLPHVSGTSHRFWRRETDLIVTRTCTGTRGGEPSEYRRQACRVLNVSTSPPFPPSPERGGDLREAVENIIKAAVARGASDLHIKSGDVFRARINGQLIPFTKQRLTPDQTRAIAMLPDPARARPAAAGRHHRLRLLVGAGGGGALPREHPAAARQLHDRDAGDPHRDPHLRRSWGCRRCWPTSRRRSAGWCW
jgi:phosphoglycerate dehydrogenase-like enzyme